MKPILISEDDLTIQQKLSQILPQHFGLTFEEVRSRSRKKDVSYARNLYCYFMRKRTIYSLEKIGEILNERDYSTIIGSVKAVKGMADVYPQVRDDIKQIDQKLKG